MLLNTLFKMSQQLLEQIHLFSECKSNLNGIDLPLWDAEFGYILYQHIPMVYGLCKQKSIKRIEICLGMRPFYYFLDKSMIKERKCFFDKSIDMKKQHEIMNNSSLVPN